MNEPTLQTDAELCHADDLRLTEIAIVNPSVALLEMRGRLTILISRDTFHDPGGIRFAGARLVQIPLGRRLAVLKLLSRIWRVRMPAEREFLRVEFTNCHSQVIAIGDGGLLCRVEDPRLVKPLTGREYFTLMTARGRDLHQWIDDHFPVCGTRGARFANGTASRRRVA